MQSRTPKLGIGVATVVAAFVLSALSALLWQAPNLNLGQIWGDAYYRHVTWFSFYQALLSTLLSVGLAVPVAHALSRRRFPGRGLLLKLFAMTLVLPVLVGVLACWRSMVTVAYWQAGCNTGSSNCRFHCMASTAFCSPMCF